jgi:short-subunit dehydrogenase
VFTKPEIEKDATQKLGWLGNRMAVSPKQVGEIAVSKTLKGKMIIVPGIISSIISGFLRLLPRNLIVYIYYKLGSKSK